MTYNKAYYEANKEKFKAYFKKYNAKRNKATAKAKEEKAKATKDKFKAYHKKYYKENKEEQNKRCKKYYEANKDKSKINPCIPAKNRYELLNELVTRQIDNGTPSKTLSYNDFKRISLKIPNSIFGLDCSIWNGKIRKHHGTYISFFFKGRKKALHRILYMNYVEPLADNEFLRFTCSNKGACCNISHVEKMRYKRPVKKYPLVYEEQRKEREKNIDKLLTVKFD